MKDLLLASVPGVAVALLTAGTQYARMPTLNRRLDRHLKLRGTIPPSRQALLDGLIEREIDALVIRDTRWLSPRLVWAQIIRAVAMTLAIGLALGGQIYIRLQPLEERLVSTTSEWTLAIGFFVLLLGYSVAAPLDGGPLNPFTYRRESPVSQSADDARD